MNTQIEPFADNFESAQPKRSWYVLYTRHQHEKTVAQILTGKGFDTFLPLYETGRRWKDRIKVLSLPLFPCYVFLNGGLQRKLDIMTTPGIHAVVSSSGLPVAIPSSEIEALQRVVKTGARAEPHPFLKCGDQIRVKYGPLTGIEGILIRKKNACRLILSVKMLGKAVAVEVEGLHVEKLSGNRPELRGIGHAAGRATTPVQQYG